MVIWIQLFHLDVISFVSPVTEVGFFLQIISSQQDLEVFATRSKVKMPSRPWMGERPSTPPPDTNQQKLVIVRGRVQTKASVESEDSKRDAEALIALNVPEKAVFIERTQTVCIHSKL